MAAGDEQRADERGVDEDADDQREAELPERAQRAGEERAKLVAVIAAAEVIRPPVWPIARTIPRRSPRFCDSSCNLVIRKTL